MNRHRFCKYLKLKDLLRVSFHKGKTHTPSLSSIVGSQTQPRYRFRYHCPPFPSLIFVIVIAKRESPLLLLFHSPSFLSLPRPQREPLFLPISKVFCSFLLFRNPFFLMQLFFVQVLHGTYISLVL